MDTSINSMYLFLSNISIGWLKRQEINWRYFKWTRLNDWGLIKGTRKSVLLWPSWRWKLSFECNDWWRRWRIEERVSISIHWSIYIVFVPRLSPFVYNWVVSHGGSISAEHGIGQLKRDYRSLGMSLSNSSLPLYTFPLFSLLTHYSTLLFFLSR